MDRKLFVTDGFGGRWTPLSFVIDGLLAVKRSPAFIDRVATVGRRSQGEVPLDARISPDGIVPARRVSDTPSTATRSVL